MYENKFIFLPFPNLYDFSYMEGRQKNIYF